MYFKIGDIVTVKKDLKKYVSYYMKNEEVCDIFCDEMREFTGEKVTISGISDTDEYEIKELANFFWTDEMFEEYDPNYDAYEEKMIHSITNGWKAEKKSEEEELRRLLSLERAKSAYWEYVCKNNGVEPYIIASEEDIKYIKGEK